MSFATLQNINYNKHTYTNVSRQLYLMSDLRVDAHVGEDPDDLDNHVLRVACVKGVYKGVQLFFLLYNFNYQGRMTTHEFLQSSIIPLNPEKTSC